MAAITQLKEWKIEFPNLPEVVRLLEKLGGDAKDLMAREMYGIAEQVMTRAKGLVPVDTGALKSSGHVLNPVIKGNEVSVTLGFGGPAGSGNLGETNKEEVGYAVHVHENLEAKHVNGQAKYLETPLQEASHQIEQVLIDGLNKAIKKVADAANRGGK